MEFQDRVLHCIDCRQDFTFTAGEQEFYERKGFKEIPKRCKPCREQRKTRRADDSGTNGSDAQGYVDHDRMTSPVGGVRPAREMFDAVCASCGAGLAAANAYRKLARLDDAITVVIYHGHLPRL